MKNIFKLMIPCLAVAFSLTSCNDTMDDKASIDAQFVKPSGLESKMVCPNCGYSADAAPAKCPTCETADSLFVTVGNVSEFGIQVSKNQDFSGTVKTIVGDFGALNFDLTATGLEEMTTYFVSLCWLL